MNIDYEIIDEYGYDEYDYLNEVIEYTMKKLKIKDSLFDIIFIDDEKMHEMNKQYRGIDRTTDVLSFALNDNKHIDAIMNSLGDIFISIPKMKSQALEYGHSEKRELSFLVLHGILHLLGYDHMNEEDEKIMFGLQKEILEELGIR
ncbi:MAG: rRNA maturation RNase YbeY [Bacilli bacterium]|nr:rRNA maturation RNase YbeY [Bacilli bacterium]